MHPARLISLPVGMLRLEAVQRHTASEPHTEHNERKHSADETCRTVEYILSLTRATMDCCYCCPVYLV